MSETTGLRFHTSGRNQGQIVTYSYAATGDGNVIERRHDASDRETSYKISKLLVGDECDYRQTSPRNKRWRKPTEAELDQYELYDQD